MLGAGRGRDKVQVNEGCRTYIPLSECHSIQTQYKSIFRTDGVTGTISDYNWDGGRLICGWGWGGGDCGVAFDQGYVLITISCIVSTYWIRL